MVSDKSGNSRSFEDALNRLSEIVKKLESKDIKLEDSMKLFEEGVNLSKYCREVLENAADKVKSINNVDSEE